RPIPNALAAKKPLRLARASAPSIAITSVCFLMNAVMFFPPVDSLLVQLQSFPAFLLPPFPHRADHEHRAEDAAGARQERPRGGDRVARHRSCDPHEHDRGLRG